MIKHHSSSTKVERLTPAPVSPRGSEGMESDDAKSPSPGSEESDSPEHSPNEARSFGRSMTMNGKPGYQAGAIVRVKLTNFVTYKSAEFRPGPHLNMVIGPNGTGKSSLVCAICLGLGFHPNILGRAAEVGEFVKHGQPHGEVEIELADEPTSHVIRVSISKGDNHRTWWLNRKKVPHKEVKRLVAKLRIQIDNLCQFLPQEKVASFAGLTPIELLRETLRAAAPPHMIDWHDQLGMLHRDQKAAEDKMEEVNVKLRSYQTRQEADELDVQRLRERQDAEEKLKDLRLARLAKVYDIARGEYKSSTQSERRLKGALKKLERNSGPALRAVRSKEEYRDLVKQVVSNRDKLFTQAGRNADAALITAENFDNRVTELDGAIGAESRGIEELKKKIGDCKKQIHHLKVQLNKTPPTFDGAQWNQKLNENRHNINELQEEIDQTETQLSSLKQQFGDKKQHAARVQRELQSLDSREGQSMSFLQRTYPDVYAAYEWVKNNQDKFEKEVFGPAMLNCSLKDDRYGDVVQSLLGENDALAFTCQTRNDHKILSDQCYRTMRLTVAIRTCISPLDKFQSPTTAAEIQALGLDGYAIDYLQGPDPVLAMLCSTARLHLSGVGLKDLSEDQYNRIAAGRKITSFTAGSQNYRITRRQEYGDRSISTSRSVRPGKFWTDQPVDGRIKAQLQEQLNVLKDEINSINMESSALMDQMNELNDKKAHLEAARKDLTAQKKEQQRAFNQHEALPGKVREKEEDLEGHIQRIKDLKDRRSELVEQKQRVLLEKAAAAIEHKHCVDELRRAYSELVVSRLFMLEAESEVQALAAKNQAIVDQLEQAKTELQAATTEAARTREVAVARYTEFTNACEEDEARRARGTELASGQSLDDIETGIAAEEAKLDMIQDVDPGLLARYQTRERDIAKLKESFKIGQEGVDATKEKVARIRGEWEPELDHLVERINEAFGYNFEQLGCAGEVSVHKDEDFEKWAIQIKVRFRENESLQILDQHRQSGGERAVTTIFYLMSLQSMAQAPFRVVDEINQGMDPRNERMVHERMVEIACREHTSQYFLITPKLLSGLRYDQRMTVLCIASGEAMPEGAAAKMDFRAMVKRRKQILKMKAEAVR